MADAGGGVRRRAENKSAGGGNLVKGTRVPAGGAAVGGGGSGAGAGSAPLTMGETRERVTRIWGAAHAGEAAAESGTAMVAEMLEHLRKGAAAVALTVTADALLAVAQAAAGSPSAKAVAGSAAKELRSMGLEVRGTDIAPLVEYVRDRIDDIKVELLWAESEELMDEDAAVLREANLAAGRDYVAAHPDIYDGFPSDEEVWRCKLKIARVCGAPEGHYVPRPDA